jgi:hypothetical protein
MRVCLKTSTALVAAITAVFSFCKEPAIAFTITRNNISSQLLTNLLGNTTGLSNFTISLTGDGRAFGTFQNDPFDLTSGIVLSTGRVIDLSGANTKSNHRSDLSTDFGLTGSPGDSISLQMSFDANSTAEKLYFQYVFGSEEFVEFGGNKFNDSFKLTLNGFNYARLSNGATVNINNLVPAPNGIYHPDFINNPVGTGPASAITKLDGYTKPLLFEAPLIKNARNTLVINVQDLTDGIYDSAVFLKGGTLGTVRPPDIGGGENGGNSRVPEPSSVLGLLSFAVLGAVCMLKKQWHR